MQKLLSDVFYIAFMIRNARSEQSYKVEIRLHSCLQYAVYG